MIKKYKFYTSSDQVTLCESKDFMVALPLAAPAFASSFAVSTVTTLPLDWPSILRIPRVSNEELVFRSVADMVPFSAKGNEGMDGFEELLTRVVEGISDADFHDLYSIWKDGVAVLPKTGKELFLSAAGLLMGTASSFLYLQIWDYRLRAFFRGSCFQGVETWCRRQGCEDGNATYFENVRKMTVERLTSI